VLPWSVTVGGFFAVVKTPGCAEVQQNSNGNAALIDLANELKSS
jgi:hypothetical protein